MNENTESLIGCLESRKKEIVAKLSGMNLFYNDGSFKQSTIYQIAGRNDYVSTISFRAGSESGKEYGLELTVTFYYTIEERKRLEEDNYFFDDKPFVKVKELLGAYDIEATKILFEKGIDINDIEEILVFPATKECNTFYSKELRDPHILKIEIDASENDDFSKPHYFLLKKLNKENVAITPEENSMYLAYKLFYEPNELTKEERDELFNENNIVKSTSVAYYYLLHKKRAGDLSEAEMEKLREVSWALMSERLKKADDELKNMGLSLEKLRKKYPDKALLLLYKIFTFHEIRYNHTGKHLLYCSFDSFLHIYLRHVEEMKVENQFVDRDRFQLKEENVMDVLKNVMSALNDEYQAYKDKNPKGKFSRYSSKAYYLNGDYYNVALDKDGSISTFYRSGVDRG